MNLSTALRLGRVSNLPTIWTNALAGAVVAGGAVEPVALAAVIAALSLFYVAGMYLNDAFDRDIDARERPDRPIPAGNATAAEVFTVGFGMMGLGLALLAWLGLTGVPAGASWALPTAGVALAAAIIGYDLHHKANPWSPAVMGLCRVLVYAIAALAVGPVLPPALVAAAAAVCCYLIGLTHAARGEAAGRPAALAPLLLLAVPVAYGALLMLQAPIALVPWLAFVGWTIWATRMLRRGGPHVGGGVAALIAGMALFDAVLLAGYGSPLVAVAVAAAFAATVALQRLIPGT